MFKKFILSALFSICAVSLSHATPDTANRVWRATEPVTNFTNVIIATVPVHVYSVIVASSSVSYSSFTIADSSSAQTSGWISQPFNAANAGDEYIIDRVLNRGFKMSTGGNPSLYIKWDYFKKIPAGFENNGR